MNIVITGASNGIGYHSCLALAAAGNTVFALSRNKDKLNHLKEEALRRKITGVIPVVADLSDTGSVSQAVAEITSTSKSLEILVNNAGKLTNKPFAALSIAEWKEVYEVNVFGTVEITRQLLPLMKAAGPGAHIVNISSMGGVQGAQKFPGLSAYTSGKAALIALSECLAEEFKEYGIAVNCLALGSVATEMFSTAFPGLKAALTPDKMGRYIADFALNGHQFYNGKVLQVSASTP